MKWTCRCRRLPLGNHKLVKKSNKTNTLLLPGVINVNRKKFPFLNALFEFYETAVHKVRGEAVLTYLEYRSIDYKI